MIYFAQMKGKARVEPAKMKGMPSLRRARRHPMYKAWFLGGMFVVGARRGQPTRMRVKPTKMKNMDMPPHEQQSPAV